jgi:hypothetical protein
MVEQNAAIEKLSAVSSGLSMFSTIDASTREGKLQTLAAIADAKPLNEYLDIPIALTNVVMQAVSVKDSGNDGEEVDAIRTLLITADGEAYAAVSQGLVSSLETIFGIMGHPSTWTEPLPVKVVEQRGRNGFRFMKIVLA